MKHYFVSNLKYVAKRLTLNSGNDKKQTILDKNKSQKNLKTVYINIPETLAGRPLKQAQQQCYQITSQQV